MFGEMDPWLVNSCYLLAAFILVIGIIFIKASANKKKKEKHEPAINYKLHIRANGVKNPDICNPQFSTYFR